MPDYTSILRRSISALPDQSPGMREAVYQRARSALARQLTAVDPPLSTREIETQHQELEDAVARLEADFQLPEPDEPELPDLLDEPDYPDDVPVEMPAFTPHVPPLTVTSVPETLGPGLQRDFDADADRDGDDDDDDDEFEDEDAASRTPLLIGLAVLVLVVLGVGVYGFSQRDRITALLGFSDTREDIAAGEPVSEAPPQPIVIPEPVQPAADEPEIIDPNKRPDRLTNGPEAPLPPEEPVPDDSTSAEVEAPLTLPGEEEMPAETLPAESPAGLQEEQTAALEQPGQSIVAQRAIYYFQGTEGSPGRATEGSVAWTQISRDERPVIQAVLRLAEQDATVTVTISKNSDSTLPASHLVEVQFAGKLGPSPIQRVPALVLKQTEQARGQPLTGAAVPVTNDLFWIALSDDPEHAKRNVELLRDGSWFDIPILFNDGTRALLTFEKGIPGDKVFETVMAGWTPPG